MLAVSCAAAGDCAAGGYYTRRTNSVQAFVVGETNGRWGNAFEVPGTATREWPNTQVSSISCSWPGDCAASGHVSTGYNRGEAFVFSETHGTWGSAILLRASCVVRNVVGRSHRCGSAP